MPSRNRRQNVSGAIAHMIASAAVETAERGEDSSVDGNAQAGLWGLLATRSRGPSPYYSLLALTLRRIQDDLDLRRGKGQTVGVASAVGHRCAPGVAIGLLGGPSMRSISRPSAVDRLRRGQAAGLALQDERLLARYAPDNGQEPHRLATHRADEIIVAELHW